MPTVIDVRFQLRTNLDGFSSVFGKGGKIFPFDKMADHAGTLALSTQL